MQKAIALRYYETCSIRQLKSVAKKVKLRRYGRLAKDELVQKIGTAIADQEFAALCWQQEQLAQLRAAFPLLSALKPEFNPFPICAQPEPLIPWIFTDEPL
ncbi:hypothetical protein IFO70_30005 [Phormidium tenue FACHB-886]|nr:hypothetical protein [Phormidium tenue FACHB-886]